MTLNDLLHSSQDVMPEPADNMEVVRLNGADYHPETTILNVRDVLSGNSPFQLKPFDLVRVFGRYEVDSPTVSIAGDVIRPGDYPLANGMTVSGLIKMAGGFRTSAYRSVADLATYTVEGGKSVLIQTKEVDLEKAMSGDLAADPKLKTHEVLSIREISGWQDIGSTVTFSGEVVHPGSYGIARGERLSSVLKRAGGFREGAFAQGIVLERTSVRIMEEKARTDMIQRIESMNLSGEVMGNAGDNSQQEAETIQMMRAQQQEALTALKASPAIGRIVVKISDDISKWENSPLDPELRADDSIQIPKRNDVVVVIGQVYDQTTFSYFPGKTVDWYLQQAGGTTRSACRRDIYILRADGSHISKRGILTSSISSVRLQPGDSIVVPEKLAGVPLWKMLFNAAQAMMPPAMLALVAMK
jgi:protein involved in polysaccharide export with SLBB domain